jgi:hypothetical protein
MATRPSAKTTRCLETRTTKDGFKRRKYQAVNGVITRTIEVPIEVWNHINRMGRASDRAAQWRRTRERDALRMKACELMQAGWKPLAVSSELGVPVRTLQRWKEITP